MVSWGYILLGFDPEKIKDGRLQWDGRTKKWVNPARTNEELKQTSMNYLDIVL
jgi:hypothetical protein